MKRWPNLIKHLRALLVLACLTVSMAQAAGDDTAPLRLGILSVAPPARAVAAWTPLAEYLGSRLGRPVEVVAPRGFERLTRAIENGEVDIFYINSQVFYRLKRKGLARPLAQMVNLDNDIYSRGVFFVRSDTSIKDLGDIKGHRVAYISPLAAGAYLAPRAELHEKGIEDAQETFTRNFLSTVREVQTNPGTVGALCRVRYGLMDRQIKRGKLRLIGETGPYPEHVLATRPDFDSELARRISTIITGMKDDPEGREILEPMASLRISHFTDYDPSVEQVTEELFRKANIDPDK